MKDVEQLQQEVEELQEKLRISVDLVNGSINLGSIIENMPQQDITDIYLLTQYPQWQSYKKWIITNAKMLWDDAATSGKEEAYIMARLSKCIIDMLQNAEQLKPDDTPKDKKDAFDLEPTIYEPAASTVGGDLPLGEE